MKNDNMRENNINDRENKCREAFREQAILHNVGDDCVIDSDTYAEISCITGCFKDGDSWVVYETDERGQVYGERRFKRPHTAFANAANRLGFTYTEPSFISFLNVSYSPQEALSLVCSKSKANFDESVDVAIHLGVDSRQADQQIRGSVVLPNGTGKERRILAFASGSSADIARRAGADFVGGQDLVTRIQDENFLSFDVVIATPDMMPVVSRVGRILGPKGLMPNPKSGTVTTDIGETIIQIKRGRIEYRLDKTNIVHCAIGKVSFGPEKLVENLDALLGAVIRAKPASAKGIYIKSCVTSSTMGPGIKVEVAQYRP